MSQFTSNFKGELIGRNKWKNLEEFEYHIGEYPSKEVIVVPVGFETDFASVPRIFWPYISPIDLHAKAAIVHDYCYYYGLYDRKRCDEIFLEALKVLNIKSNNFKDSSKYLTIFKHIKQLDYDRDWD